MKKDKKEFRVADGKVKSEESQRVHTFARHNVHASQHWPNKL